MPYLRIQTNQQVEPSRRASVLEHASHTVSEALGKSEAYVMVALEDDAPMRFGASAEPLAYLELKSIGLPAQRTAELSRTLCTLVEQELGVPASRVYIEFADAPRSMWGWNGATF